MVRGRSLVAIGVLAASLALGGPARAAGGPCQPPSWAGAPLPGYVLASCKAKPWATEQVYLANGNRTITGRRVTVEYDLKDSKKDLHSKVVRDHYVHLAKGLGAKLKTDPDDVFSAILVRHRAKGATWYDFEHGDGDENSTLSYTLTTVETTRFDQVVVARAFKGVVDTTHCRKPKWLVKQFPYFKRSGCENRDYDSVKLELPDGEKRLAGHVHAVDYALTVPNKDPVARYVRDNYIHALKKIGAKLVSDPSDVFHAYLMQKGRDGAIWYLYVHGAGNENSTTSYSLETIQVGGPPPKRCKVEVYGIHFDFNKATLRPDSKPVLEALLGIFRADPHYRAEIGGHTDNRGSAAYNLTLSRRRASAVRAWLVAHGVAASRLTSRGYGESRPLVPNTSAKNRAKNRRVELKRKDCHRG